MPAQAQPSAKRKRGCKSAATGAAAGFAVAVGDLLRVAGGCGRCRGSYLRRHTYFFELESSMPCSGVQSHKLASKAPRADAASGHDVTLNCNT